MSAVMASPHGDDVRLAERLVVAPVAGVFRPHPPHTYTSEGEILLEGEVLGVVEGPGSTVDVVSFCTGFLMELLAEDGERVRPGQPLAWLHVIHGMPPQ
ncbi:MAG: hypothetical protein JWN46_1565 [Acidimicrobiales bacterium]|nr:hypothetical protein [Acidimicrobiales bacterium]